MGTEFTVQKATASDAPEVAEMVGELLEEIMNAIGIQAFNFDLAETTSHTRKKRATVMPETHLLGKGDFSSTS